VLWRIKDAEELIKERVSSQRVTNLISELENRLLQLLKTSASSTDEKIDAEFKKLEKEIADTSSMQT
jgi:nucleosome binding factor SPN SPT16 subunit